MHIGLHPINPVMLCAVSAVCVGPYDGSNVDHHRVPPVGIGLLVVPAVFPE